MRVYGGPKTARVAAAGAACELTISSLHWRRTSERGNAKSELSSPYHRQRAIEIPERVENVRSAYQQTMSADDALATPDIHRRSTLST
jgi:hypothetical protein